MERKLIDKLKIFITSLALAGTTSLSGCGAKAYIEKPIQDYFYDDNIEGIDDTFENQAINSKQEIDNVSKIERYIKLSEEIEKIDDEHKDEYLTIKNDEIDYSKIDETEISRLLDEINNSENGLTPGEEEQIYLKKTELNRYNGLIKHYLVNVASQDIDEFILDIVKSIIINTAGYSETTDNMTIVHGEYIGSSIPEQYHVDYSNGSFSDMIDYVPKSIIYNLIEDIISIREIKENYKKEDYDKLIDKYKEALDRVKKSLDLEYELQERGPLGFLDESLVGKHKIIEK